MRELLKLCMPAIERGEKVIAELPIKNINRVVGTIVGNEIAKRYGENGLPEDTITLNFKGSAGQSFGAFTPKGMTFVLEGDANDYVGKGLSGSRVVIYPHKSSTFVAEENMIIGNVAFYGAISGEAYIRGMAGERFCVRNSGIKAIVEAVGDHCCEYMTGGRVVVLGSTGRNFAAGMSGGIAYVLDQEGDFHTKCNKEMVDTDKLTDKDEIHEVRGMIEQHLQYTESTLAKKILDNWGEILPNFVKVIPKDYKRMILEIEKAKENGLSGEDALMAAFENTARVGGN
jgi:glutamate synthase (ferredoxin)